MKCYIDVMYSDFSLIKISGIRNIVELHYEKPNIKESEELVYKIVKAANDYETLKSIIKNQSKCIEENSKYISKLEQENQQYKNKYEKQKQQKYAVMKRKNKFIKELEQENEKSKEFSDYQIKLNSSLTSQLVDSIEKEKQLQQQNKELIEMLGEACKFLEKKKHTTQIAYNLCRQIEKVKEG